MNHKRLVADNHEFRGDGTAIIDMVDYESATFTLESGNADNTLTVQEGDESDLSDAVTFNDGINDAIVTGAADGEMLVIEARHPAKRYVRVQTSGTSPGTPGVILVPRHFPAVTAGTVLTVSN